MSSVVRHWSKIVMGSLIECLRIIDLSKRMSAEGANAFLARNLVTSVSRLEHHTAECTNWMANVSRNQTKNEVGHTAAVMKVFSKVLEIRQNAVKTRQDLSGLKESLLAALKNVRDLEGRFKIDQSKLSQDLFVVHHPSAHRIARRAVIEQIRRLDLKLLVSDTNQVEQPQHGYARAYTVGKWSELLHSPMSDLLALYKLKDDSTFECVGYALVRDIEHARQDTAPLRLAHQREVHALSTLVPSVNSCHENAGWLEITGIDPAYRNLQRGSRTYDELVAAMRDIAHVKEWDRIELHWRKSNIAGRAHMRNGAVVRGQPLRYSASGQEYVHAFMPFKGNPQSWLAESLETREEGHINGQRFVMKPDAALQRINHLMGATDLNDVSMSSLLIGVMYQNSGRLVIGHIEHALDCNDPESLSSLETHTRSLVMECIAHISSHKLKGAERTRYLNDRHAEFSVALVRDWRVLETLPQKSQQDVLDAILFHSAYAFPSDDLFSPEARKLCEVMRCSESMDRLIRASTAFCRANNEESYGMLGQLKEYLGSAQLPHIEFLSTPWRLGVGFINAILENRGIPTTAYDTAPWLHELHDTLTKPAPEFIVRNFEQGIIANRNEMIEARSYQGFLVYFMCQMNSLPKKIQRELLMRESIDAKFTECLKKLHCPEDLLKRIEQRWHQIREGCLSP